MSAITSRGLDIGRAYPVAGAPERGDERPGSFPGRGNRERESKQAGGEIMSIYT
jgi:hypothetical protein